MIVTIFLTMFLFWMYFPSETQNTNVNDVLQKWLSDVVSNCSVISVHQLTKSIAWCVLSDWWWLYTLYIIILIVSTQYFTCSVSECWEHWTMWQSSEMIIRHFICKVTATLSCSASPGGGSWGVTGNGTCGGPLHCTKNFLFL